MPARVFLCSVRPTVQQGQELLSLRGCAGSTFGKCFRRKLSKHGAAPVGSWVLLGVGGEGGSAHTTLTAWPKCVDFSFFKRWNVVKRALSRFCV